MWVSSRFVFLLTLLLGQKKIGLLLTAIDIIVIGKLGIKEGEKRKKTKLSVPTPHLRINFRQGGRGARTQIGWSDSLCEMPIYMVLVQQRSLSVFFILKKTTKRKVEAFYFVPDRSTNIHAPS